LVTGSKPNQTSSGNLNNITREGSRHFWNKKKEYLKAKINELETNIKKIAETSVGASMTLRRVTSLYPL
jgi:hypothetical protein